MKVAIQGELGAFSHEAAKRMLPRCTVVPCARSAEVFDRLERESVGAAVIPIENTLAGTVAEHADLMLTHEVFIQGGVSAAHRTQRDRRAWRAARSLRRVLSHPVALDQCRDFFRRHPKIEAVPFYDTAGSVKHVIANQLERCRGNCRTSGRARVLEALFEPSVEDDKRNFTRFFLIRNLGRVAGKHRLCRSSPDSSGANKTSIVFQVKNVPGALFKSLSVFALRDISLSKIESRPMRGRPWEYVFYADFLRGDDEPARNALRHLGEVAEFVKVLGIYPAV